MLKIIKDIEEIQISKEVILNEIRMFLGRRWEVWGKRSKRKLLRHFWEGARERLRKYWEKVKSGWDIEAGNQNNVTHPQLAET